MKFRLHGNSLWHISNNLHVHRLCFFMILSNQRLYYNWIGKYNPDGNHIYFVMRGLVNDTVFYVCWDNCCDFLYSLIVCIVTEPFFAIGLWIDFDLKFWIWVGRPRLLSIQESDGAHFKSWVSLLCRAMSLCIQESLALHHSLVEF